jgi:peptide/nickel transport system substrate-binding protein
MRITVWVPKSHWGEGPFAAKLLRSLGYRALFRNVSPEAFYGPPPFAGPPDSVQAGLTSWFADFPSASNYIGLLFSCKVPLNYSGFCDRTVEERIRRARELQATDPHRANKLWAALDRAIVDRAPIVPLFALKEIDVVSPRVRNYVFSPQWGVLSPQLWVR